VPVARTSHSMIWEAEIRRITVLDKSEQKVRQTPSEQKKLVCSGVHLSSQLQQEV
jgi:hypothetical protein